MGQKKLLTLSKEFIEYCKLNEIDDVETHAKKVFDMGFAFAKFGSSPGDVTPLVEGTTKSNVKKKPKEEKKAPPPPPPAPLGRVLNERGETIRRGEPNKVRYDE